MERRYLPALDGLRAFAVLAVIGFHAELPGIGGGFLGVEVFFVVSGYLITSLLLRERRDTGGISVPRFLFRRARRLLPALFTLLLVALVLSLSVARDSLEQTRNDATAALFYVSNWWQVIQHRSYFMAIERPPLLLHLWSLAVEEQFYLLWPLIVALLARHAPRFIGPVALLGSAASALWMAHLFDPNLDPTRAYVGSDTRLSGLLLGAALSAYVRAPVSDADRVPRVPRALSEALALAGSATLLWAFVHVDSHAPFVYRGGLLVVDLASCALLSGLLAPSAARRIFGAAPLAWLGRRSYGLYLWHWPVFGVTRPDLDLPLNGWPLFGLRLTLTFVTAELCYRFVEMPVRRGALAPLFQPRPLLLATSALSLVAVAATLSVLSGRALGQAGMANALPASLQARGSNLPAPELDAPARAPRAAPGVALDPAWPKTLTLLSDSVGLSLSQALPAALPGWKVEVLGRPALMVKQAVAELLNARGVGSVVVVALGYNSLFEKDRKHYNQWSALWDRGAERLLSDLRACGARKLVWVTLREPSAALVTDAGRDQYQRYAWFFPYVNERIRALATRHPELALADWQAVSNVPNITKDSIHLNPAGVALMTDTVRRAILGADVLPKPIAAEPRTGKSGSPE